jgi:integrase
LLYSLNESPFIAYARLIRKLANNVLNRQVRPTLNRCQKCGLPKGLPHVTEDKHDWANDTRLPQWHGWHACRRGLGSNLYPLGGTDLVIQKILRHADVSTTQEYYIKGKTPDARKALVKLGKAYAKKSVGQTLTDSERTRNSDSGAMSGFVN